MIIRNIIIFNLDKAAIYLDEIISKFDEEKVFQINPSGCNNLIDLKITLEKYSENVRNIKFSLFNYIRK
jgi:hypothetical protein